MTQPHSPTVRLDEATLRAIASAYPGLAADYLAYLRDTGWGESAIESTDEPEKYLASGKKLFIRTGKQLTTGIRKLRPNHQ